MLVRYSPYRDVVTMRRALDRLAEKATDRAYDQAEFSKAEWALALDVVEHESEYQVKASLPGVKPEDVEITFDKGLLTVRGELKDEHETKQGKVHLRERRFGSFVRTISMPSTIQADHIQAEYKDGVLTLRLPKAEEAKPRRITVNAASQN